MELSWGMHRTNAPTKVPASRPSNRRSEAEVIRVRVRRALDANLWPTRRSLARLFAEHETTDAQH